jgi:hypothetical protein
MRRWNTTRRAGLGPLDRALRPLPNAIAPRRIAVVFSASVAWHAHINIETLPRTLLSANRYDNGLSARRRVSSIRLD